MIYFKDQNQVGLEYLTTGPLVGQITGSVGQIDSTKMVLKYHYQYESSWAFIMSEMKNLTWNSTCVVISKQVLYIF